MALVTTTSDLGYFHQNEALSQYAQGYGQDATNFIGSQIAPIIEVDNKSDTYYIGDTAHMQLHDLSRRPGSVFAQLEWAVSEDAYVCKSYGAEVTAPFEEAKNADAAIAVEQENVTLAVDALMIASEYRTMLVATNTSTFPNTVAKGGNGSATKWNAFSSSVSTGDPYFDVEAAKDTVVAGCGELPNTMWMNYNTWRAMFNNTFVKARVLNTEPGSMITPAILANLYDVEQVLIARGKFDGSQPGSGNTPAFQYIWPDGVVGLAYIDNRIGPLLSKIIAPMRTFVWTVMGGRFGSRSYVDDRRAANVVQTVDYVDEHVTCAAAQALITGCI